MEKTRIDWCDSTWNPVTGCRHGCDYCYAESMARRFDGGKILKNGVRTVLDKPVRINGKAAPYPYGFIPTFHKYRLDNYKTKEGRRIFVCSMADLFGAWIPDEWIEDVFGACVAAPQHTYLFLTKNPERYYCLQDSGDLPDYENMWYGITVTNKAQIERAVKAAGNLWGTVRTFLSIEPLHEDITQSEYWDPENLRNIFDWFIVGAETGRRPGKITPERKWIENIVETCSNIAKPVFLKSGRGIMEEIWGEPLLQEYPEKMRASNRRNPE
mgnify:CR=1 FL=1